MKILGIVITGEVTFINFKLSILMEEVLPQFDTVILYTILAKSANQGWSPSYLAIKVL